MTDVMPEQLVDLDEVGGGEPAPRAPEGLAVVDEQLIARLAGLVAHLRAQAVTGLAAQLR